MTHKTYFHLTGDGAIIKDFIHSEIDSIAAINLVGVCACHTGAVVLAFGHEDTHPHSLLYGTREDCMQYKLMYENSYLHHVIRTRPAPINMRLDLDLLEIKDENHLMNAGTYILIQASKDGKQIMPYDDRRGTGSLYFRQQGHVPIWCFDSEGAYHPPIRADQISARDMRAVCHSHMSIPGHWLISNGIILPENYVDVKRFESIYRTANCFRTFLGSGRGKQQEIKEKLASARGVVYDDLEAKRLRLASCKQLFNIGDVRRLNGPQRIHLAQHLWQQYRLSRRQLSSLVFLPYEEICKYT